MAEKEGYESFPPGTMEVFYESNDEDERKSSYNVPFSSLFFAVDATPDESFRRNIAIAQEILVKELCSIIETIFCDLLLVDKKEAVLFLNSQKLYLLENVDGLTKEYVQHVLSKKHQIVAEKFSSTDIAITIKNISKLTLDPWHKAIADFELEKGNRKNSALAKRMRVFLRRLEGESPTDIQKDYPNENLTRMLATAQNKDVQELKKCFPELPPLPNITKSQSGS